MILSKYTYSRLVFLWVFIINASAQDTLFRYFTHNFHYDTLINNEPVNTIITAVEEVNDGYISFGLIGENGSELLFAHKIDFRGQVIWTKLLDNDSNNKSLTTGRQVFTLSDSSIVVFYEKSYGQNGSSNWCIIRIDKDGTVIDFIEFDDPYGQAPVVGCESLDHNILLIGWEQKLNPTQSPHIIVKKINLSMETMWQREYYYNPVNSTHPISILPTSDGNYLIGGNIQVEFNSGDGYDHFLLKIDEQGDTLWTKQWGTEGNDGRITVLMESDSTFIMTSSVESINQEWIKYYGKVDNEGNVYNEHYITYNYESAPGSDFIILDDKYAVYGFYLNSNGQWEPELWQLDLNFEKVFSKELYYDSFASFYRRDTYASSDGGIIFAGYTVPENPPQEGWIIKIDSLGNHCSFLGCDSIVLDSTTYSNYLSAFESGRFKIHMAPNPCKDQFTLSYELPQRAESTWFSLYDSRGIERRSLRLSDAIGTKEVELSHCEPGIYFWRLIIGQRIIKSGKIMVSR